jgi:hypothetical protein
MSRLALLACLFTAAALTADAEKPVVPKEDELAVLADPKSPDHQTVLDKYGGKVLKVTGRTYHHPGANPPQFATPGLPGTPDHFVVRVREKTAKEPAVELPFQWSKDPSVKAVEKQVRETGTRGKPGTRTVSLTIYARLQDGKLVDAATDPKVGGASYTPKEKEPARLKK